MATSNRSLLTLFSKRLPRKEFREHDGFMSWHDRLEAALAFRGHKERKAIGEALALAVGGDPVNGQTVGRWLDGKHQPPYQYLLALCRMAGVTVDEVLDDTRPLRLEMQPGVAELVSTREEGELDAALVRQAKRHHKRPKGPGREPGAQGGGSRTPRRSGGPQQGQLGEAAVGPPEEEGPPAGKR